MDDKFKRLVADVMAEHPGPWFQSCGYGDNGGSYTSIVDAKHNDVFDGDSGHLSEPILNLLLNFPELAEVLLSQSSPAGQPT